MSVWNFYSAGQLIFGRGSVGQLGDLVRRRKLNKVLVVTDKVLVGVGVAERVLDPLHDAGIDTRTFDGGEAEPSFAVAAACAETARDFSPDAILGLGGGSNMDLAKVTAVVQTHGGTNDLYFGFDNVPGPVLPLVCVPTTAGTGSEVSHAAVLTDTANEMKVSTLSNYLRPSVAVVDPELTISCPRTVTADSGIDALTHAIEAYTATDYDRMETAASGYSGRFPLADCIAEKAIELVGQHLVTAVNEPDNRTAREGMALASTLAGIAFSNAGVALVHAMEYPLGGMLHCSHGAGNGLLLPYVMRFTMPERKGTFARIARQLGVSIEGLSEDAAAERAIEAVEQLRRDIGIPACIRDLGGTAEQIPAFAEKAFSLQRLMWLTPRRPSLDDVRRIFEEAL